MGSMYSLMDILVFGCGLYIIYAYYMLKVKGEINGSLLLPKDTNVKKCKDKKAYISEIAPKLLAYGISVTVCGGLGLLESYKGFLGKWYLVLIAALLVVTFWFALTSRKCAEKYFPVK